MSVYAFVFVLLLPSFGGEATITVEAPGAYTEIIAQRNCERMRAAFVKGFKEYTFKAQPGDCQPHPSSIEPRP